MEKPLTQLQSSNDYNIKGLTLVNNFITKEQETNLIKSILAEEWNTSLKRRTQHYGYEYRYDRRNEVSESAPIPQWAMEVKMRVEEFVNNKALGIQSEHEHNTTARKPTTFTQLIINEYTPGQGINPHIDNMNLFSSPVVSLSLGSQCIMQFDNETTQPQRTEEVILKRRSIVVLDKEARSEWKHSIPARKKDHGKVRGVRYSLTWRVMRGVEEKNKKNVEMQSNKKESMNEE